MKDRESLLASRWLRPFAHLFSHPSLWHLNRRSFPRGLAVGFFIGFMIPLGQFVLAALLSVPLRANVPLAAATTLITNPITFPAIYYAAFKVGETLLGGASGSTAEAANSMAWKALDVSLQTAVGLFVFAAISSVLAFALASLWWRMRLVRRWRTR